MASMLTRYTRNHPEAETRRLLEGVVVQTVMLSVALDEKFDAHCSILDIDDRGLGSKINYIVRRLVLSPFAF
jgi:hypothetical protein